MCWHCADQPCGQFVQTPELVHLLGAPRATWSLPVFHPELPLQDLANAFKQEAQITGKARLLLSAAVSAARPSIEAGYEVGQIAP